MKYICSTCKSLVKYSTRLCHSTFICYRLHITYKLAAVLLVLRTRTYVHVLDYASGLDALKFVYFLTHMLNTHTHTHTRTHARTRTHTHTFYFCFPIEYILQFLKLPDNTELRGRKPSWLCIKLLFCS